MERASSGQCSHLRHNKAKGYWRCFFTNLEEKPLNVQRVWCQFSFTSETLLLMVTNSDFLVDGFRKQGWSLVLFRSLRKEYLLSGNGSSSYTSLTSVSASLGISLSLTGSVNSHLNHSECNLIRDNPVCHRVSIFPGYRGRDSYHLSRKPSPA